MNCIESYRSPTRLIRFALLLGLLAGLPQYLSAQLGDWVASQQRISDTRGGFGGSLADGDTFGISVEGLGDLDGDGRFEVAVGAQFDDGLGTDRGSIWVLSLRANGTVLRETKIADQSGGFTGALSDSDLFGHALANIGDLDGDGVVDLAASAVWDGDGGAMAGAVWILFLNSDGTVKNQTKISATQGGFAGPIAAGDLFGIEMEAPGDLDGDGLPDLIVGAMGADFGGADRGVLFVLYLNADGTVKNHVQISDGMGGFTGALADGDQFGAGLAYLDDLDGDGVRELAVGTHGSDEAGNMSGSIWILFMNANETVKGVQKISASDGNFGGTLSATDLFGLVLGALPDLDGDGRNELGVSAILDDQGGQDRGALWVLFLQDDGSVRTQIRIASGSGGFGGTLRNDDHFGRPAIVGDINSDGVLDIAVGSTGNDDGGNMRGAVWILHLNQCIPASVASRNGLGLNPAILSALNSPTIGSTWSPSVDATGLPVGSIFLVGRNLPSAGTFVQSGELLIDLNSSRVISQVRAHVGQPTAFDLDVPADPALCGLVASFQAAITNAPGLLLSNALDIVVGQ